MKQLSVWGGLALVVTTAAACDLNELGHVAASTVGDLSHGPAPRGEFDARLRDACGPGGATQLGVERFARYPYLQRATANSVDIVWTSDQAADVEVWHSVDGMPAEVQVEEDRSAAPRGATQYVARVSGLEPDTTYCYGITSPAGDWQVSTGFHTAPPPGEGVPVKFLAVGDLGEATTDQFAVLDQMLTVQPDFAVITGDIAYENGTLQQFEDNFFAVYQPILERIPFFPASGNHDYETADAAAFREVYVLPENGGENGRERWYSFDWGDVHVAVLDTEVQLAAQAEWLARDLAESELPWKIVVLHRPPYSSGSHGSDMTTRKAFETVIQEQGVDLVLAGHDHHYERTAPIDGTLYIVTGGGGRGVRSSDRSSWTEISDSVAHFVYLTVDDSGLTGHAIDATGADFDSFRIEK